MGRFEVKMKTAVEQLLEWCNDHVDNYQIGEVHYKVVFLLELQSHAKRFLDLERQQIENAYKGGNLDGLLGNSYGDYYLQLTYERFKEEKQ